MKKIKMSKVIATLLLTVSAVALNQVQANAEWVQKYTDPPSFSYKENDSWATGWRYIDNHWHYFDPDTGNADTGWNCIDGHWYYFTQVKGAMTQSLITPYYYESEKGVYYVNSDGIYIENPPQEIQAYINLLKDRDLSFKLKIIGSGTREFGNVKWGMPSDMRPDGVVVANISDNDKDGILEMYTESSFDIKCTVKYIGGKLYVYDNENNLISSTDTSINNASTTTKNIIDESGLKFDANAGKVIGYRGDNTELDIPSTINGVNVTGIGDSAFALSYKLTSIKIPNSVTSIGKDAFKFCDNAKFYVENEKTKELLINSGVDKSKIIL